MDREDRSDECYHLCFGLELMIQPEKLRDLGNRDVSAKLLRIVVTVVTTTTSQHCFVCTFLALDCC